MSEQLIPSGDIIRLLGLVAEPHRHIANMAASLIDRQVDEIAAGGTLTIQNAKLLRIIATDAG